MAIDQATNGAVPQARAQLDPSKLVITLAKELKPLPELESLVFGETKTDHMLVVNHDPVHGWSTPEIKPYGPLAFDPMASCFHYCPNIFEGMKAYIGPNGEARLFRPEKNMARLARSAERVALPPFDQDAVLALIKRLIEVEARWIPKQPGYSLYIRPTIIGTRPGIPLLAVSESVRAWPGGTGGHKLGGNYAPGFLPQRVAAKQGYSQILYLLGDDERVTEAGAMNFFVAIQRDDGNVDLITPPLDGTILPGITRASGKLQLHGVPETLKIHTHERTVTMAEVAAWSEQGRLLEAFCVGTAVVVAPVSKIGWKSKDLILPTHEGIETTMIEIQTGKKEFEGWSVVCF
ncbi:branched-chain amino acid aminotransferase II [Gymnopilus junonius]|uniref:Branched-chain-amino-acid aminotransferase n=1 Tax=Gymnopilus junonius TaxID=109634 RepID=A0A9P5N9R1_GYMJU|nr:branched-chain amino acid aminotransferase II [Gymnopilus junonius]